MIVIEKWAIRLSLESQCTHAIKIVNPEKIIHFVHYPGFSVFATRDCGFPTFH